VLCSCHNPLSIDRNELVAWYVFSVRGWCDIVIFRYLFVVCFTGLANLSSSHNAGSVKKAPPAASSFEQYKQAAKDREDRQRAQRQEQERLVLR